MILVEMKSADKGKIKNCELLGELYEQVSLLTSLTYDKNFQVW